MIKRITIKLLGLFVFSPMLFGQCYELVWSDEFNGTELDTSIWQFEVYGDGGGNNELQYYTDKPENLEVKDGYLNIIAREEQYLGRNYTSARINTRGKFNFKYGKIEARIKNPYGQGIWPAFWLLGKNLDIEGWPDCGEIDIMEMIGGEGNDNTIHSTLHWGPYIDGGHPSYGQSYTLPSGIFADNFHIIETIWNEDSVATFCDGELFYIIDISAQDLEAFHNEFFMIINLAVGGNWPGSPDATTVFPQTFQIDYIRLYQTLDMVAIEGPDDVYANDSLVICSLPEVDGWIYDWSAGNGYDVMSKNDSSSVNVNWNCESGTIACAITGDCGDKTYQKNLEVKNPEITGSSFFLGNDLGLIFSAPLLHSSTYSWTVQEDAAITSGQGTNSIIVDWGMTEGEVQVIIENGCGTNTLSKTIYLYGQFPFPDPEQKHIIPGTINAAEYDYGGEGVAYHDAEPLNQGAGPRQDEGVDTEYSDQGGPNVGWITNGEWLEFSVSVAETRDYSILIRTASNYAGTRGPLSVLVDDEIRGTIELPNTEGWANFTTVRTNVYLSEEDTLIRLNMGIGGFNLGDMTFGDPLSISTNSEKEVSVYPNPFHEFVTVVSKRLVSKIEIMDYIGRILSANHGEGLVQYRIETSNLVPGMYLLIVKFEDRNSEIIRIVK